MSPQEHRPRTPQGGGWPGNRQAGPRGSGDGPGASPDGRGRGAPTRGTGETPPPPPGRRLWLTFLIILGLNFVLARVFFPPSDAVTVSYTLFRQQAMQGNVESIYSRGTEITGRFKSPVTYPPEPDSLGRTPQVEVTTFETVLPAFVDPGIEELLISHGVEISAEPIETGSPWLTLLFGFAPAILIIAFYLWIVRRASAQGGGMGAGMLGGLGKSRARRYDVETGEERVSFEDVAGIDEAENELVEIVDFLRDPQKYTRLGGTAPKGVLLVGAPGTGKTLLARAVAGEASVPFFSMAGSEFVEMIVGVGAARVRDLFKQAREHAPAIIFIDELDSIGRARGQVAIGGSSEQEQTLNQILTEMDGFSSRKGIIVLAATNQPDVLDRALLRPGRFARRVVVNLPDRTGREAILKVHVRLVPLAADVSLAEIAGATPGLSGADLRNLVNEAALLAARRDRSEVHQKDFLDALEKIVLGPERPLLLSPADRERIAYHEGGHAILGLVVPGAENDIEQVTQLARRMVTHWGMSDKLGMVRLAPRENPYLSGAAFQDGPRSFSEETARVVDAEVLRIVDECHEEARRLLTQHRRELDALAAALLERETLDEQEILEVTGLAPAPALESEKVGV